MHAGWWLPTVEDLSNLQRDTSLRDPNDPSSYVGAPTSSARVMTDHRQLIYLFLKRNPHSALRKRRLRPRDACLTIVTLSLSLVLRRRTKLRACISRPSSASSKSFMVLLPILSREQSVFSSPGRRFEVQAATANNSFEIAWSERRFEVQRQPTTASRCAPGRRRPWR